MTERYKTVRKSSTYNRSIKSCKTDEEMESSYNKKMRFNERVAEKSDLEAG